MVPHPALELLAIIAGEQTTGFFDVRIITEDRALQDFFPLRRPQEAAAYATRNAKHGDAYVGCAPRTERKGGAEAVEQAWCLWVDCDSEDSSGPLSEFPHPPTLTVESGTPGNLHAWWSLLTPITPVWAERANRRLAHALGADGRCAEPARVLRLPGTVNHKHTPPRAVTTVTTTDMKYRLSDLVSNLEDPPAPVAAPAPSRSVRDVSGPDPLLGISARLYVPALTGHELNARGKAVCPFHEDWSPSLQAYEDPGRGWHCFQCQRGGSIYNLGSWLWGLETRGDEFLRLRERLTEEMGV